MFTVAAINISKQDGSGGAQCAHTVVVHSPTQLCPPELKASSKVGPSWSSMHRMLSVATKQAVNQLLPDASYTGWHGECGIECKGLLDASRVASYGIASNTENSNEPPPSVPSIRETFAATYSFKVCFVQGMAVQCGTPGMYVLQGMVDAC